ncbi:ATP-binding cassette domain-containing protein, partial [Ruminococcus sp.]|uniref:ATP-binding cassette domain-containing protein n=1 Tax=Ruminococcus sp. TaxID=41978 RepID=UPI0038631246
MPQNPQLLFVKDTLLEDFKAVSNDSQRIDKLCKKFNLVHLLNHHPFDLSGGEIQRAGFVKLLLIEPKFLLLDEPTKGCDSFSKAELAHILQDLSQSGITILLVTHDLDFSATVSTACAMLFNGTLSKRLEPHEFYCGKRFYTTSANKISRGIANGIITTEELLLSVKGADDES